MVTQIFIVSATCRTIQFYTTPEKFENAALFLRLGLPSTLIRHEKRSFSKTLFQQEGFENASFSGVSVWTENILKTELFENYDVTIIM